MTVAVFAAMLTTAVAEITGTMAPGCSHSSEENENSCPGNSCGNRSYCITAMVAVVKVAMVIVARLVMVVMPPPKQSLL